jgi:hypothetical protein
MLPSVIKSNVQEASGKIMMKGCFSPAGALLGKLLLFVGS